MESKKRILVGGNMAIASHIASSLSSVGPVMVIKPVHEEEFRFSEFQSGKRVSKTKLRRCEKGLHEYRETGGEWKCIHCTKNLQN